MFFIRKAVVVFLAIAFGVSSKAQEMSAFKAYGDGNGAAGERRYIGAFVFDGGDFESVAWDEGRIFADVPVAADSTAGVDSLARGYRDCWFAGDHLGNVRTVIDITPDLVVAEILEQNDYLPFGTKVRNSGQASFAANRWRYAGKEEQRFNWASASQTTSLDLSLLDFGARMYDPFTARWTAVDPMAGKYQAFSPISYCNNNPVIFYDLLGLSTHTDYKGNVITIKDDGDLGVYRHGGSREEIADYIHKNHSSNNTSCGGEMMGKTWFIDSFAAYGKRESNNDYTVAKDAKIDFDSDELTQVVDGIISEKPSIIKYASKARSKGEWDIKTQITEGSILNGKYASPRDAGNIAAGMFSASKGKILSAIIDYGYGAYNLNGNNLLKTVSYIIVTNTSLIAPNLFLYTSVHGEDPISKQRQGAGHRFYESSH